MRRFVAHTYFQLILLRETFTTSTELFLVLLNAVLFTLVAGARPAIHCSFSTLTRNTNKFSLLMCSIRKKFFLICH
jgi:hypothetical protein